MTTMTSAEVSERSSLVKAQSSAASSMIDSISASSAPEESGEAAPPSSEGGAKSKQQEESSGGGCGGVMKVIGLVAVVVTTIWFPAAAPAAMALNQAVNSIPEESAGSSGKGVDVAAMDQQISDLADELLEEWENADTATESDTASGTTGSLNFDERINQRAEEIRNEWLAADSNGADERMLSMLVESDHGSLPVDSPSLYS